MPKRKPITLEMIAANKTIYDAHFRSEFAVDLVEHLLQHIADLYFRASFVGFDPMPERNDPERPLIFASNHSGMAFPWDAIIFVAMLTKINNYDFNKSVRALTAPMLSMSTLMNPFLVDHFWKRSGGVDASFLNFSTMMHYPDSHLLVYPEGVPGIGKGFNHRYQLQRFATSFVRHAIRYRSDIIPFATVNGEYINPYNVKSEWVNAIARKMGIPFIPVGFMTLLIPFQPWLFYFGFPARLTYVMGKRIRAYDMIDKPYEEISDDEFQDIADHVKTQMQDELDAAVKQHGQHPFRPREMFTGWRKNLRKFPFFLPPLWPSLFNEFDRLAKQGRVHALKINLIRGFKAHWKNPISFAFYIPILGWIPILIRGYRDRRRLIREARAANKNS